MYKTNTPNYVKSFSDFGSDNKEDLKKIKNSNTKNNIETKQIIGNKKLYFNPITKKMDDLSPDEINDKLLESTDLDLDLKNKIERTKAYKSFEDKLFSLISNLRDSMNIISDEINYNELSNKDTNTLTKSIIDSVNKF